MTAQIPPFLRIPPFPGSRPRIGTAHWDLAPDDIETLAEALREARVGGQFWGRRPDLGGGIVMLPDDTAQASDMRNALGGRTTAVQVQGDCDPWHVAENAQEIWAGARQDIVLVARLLGRSVRVFGSGPFADASPGGDSDQALREALAASAMVDPFTGGQITPLAAIDLLGEWRRMIDGNRAIGAVFGVAGWKRKTVDPLLWDGQGPVRHARSSRDAMLRGGSRAIAWKSRTPAALLAALDSRGIVPGEIEDGMIRSIGLGANCVPPLSVIVDARGIYFDPGVPSDLEVILAEAEMPPELLARAAALRKRIVREGISKYARADGPAHAPRGGQRRVLVTGQVEDDRSIQTGGAGMTNLALLTAARALEPDAWIVYKPHPDVEAGHRKGLIPDLEALHFANEIERAIPITTLMESVDALHVITSLAGFEALLRDKPVTVHGVPFYAGWGLTTDLAPIPPRRKRRLSIDELVAGTLILYPRYVDPVSFLPCSPELLIDRISNNLAKVSSPLIVIREVQGRLRKVFKRLINR